MKFDAPVLLVGNGPVDNGAVALAQKYAVPVIAADGGAKTALSHGLNPEAIIGDLDSVDFATLPSQQAKVIHMTEQDTTDFEKCLNLLEAPLLLGLGFLGGRLDHELAALNALVKYSQAVVLIGSRDLVFRIPPKFTFSGRVNTRISFFPMGRVRGVESVGLEWDITGIDMHPAGAISSSNRLAAKTVSIANPQQPLLCVMPRENLGGVLNGFKS